MDILKVHFKCLRPKSQPQALIDMRSVKLHEDTLAALRAARVRGGGSYDSVVAELIRRQAESVDPIIHGADQLDRIENQLLEIRDLLRAFDGACKSNLGGSYEIK